MGALKRNLWEQAARIQRKVLINTSELVEGDAQVLKGLRVH